MLVMNMFRKKTKYAEPVYTCLSTPNRGLLTVRKPISALGCSPNATGELPLRLASMWSRTCKQR